MVITLKSNSNITNTKTHNADAKQQLFWLLLLGAAYCLRDIVRIPMPDIVLTGLCAMAFLFLSTGSAMGVYLFTSALTVPDFEIRVVYLVVLLVKFWMQKKKFKASVLLITVGMVFLELLDMTLFDDRELINLLYTAAMRLTYFVLPLFWFSGDHSREDYRRALLCYVAGVILGGAVILWISVRTVGWETLLQGSNVRLGMNTTTGYETQSQIQTGYNANQLGGMFAVVMAIVFAMMDHKYMSKSWSVIWIIFSAFMTMLTKSRTAILLSLGVVALYWAILMFRRKKLFTGIAFLAAIAVLAYGMTVLFPDAVESLLARFLDEDNITGGRDELFVKYMLAWMENIWVLIFGYGVGSYSKMVNISNVPHNFLTDILISWGAVGFVGIACLLCILYKRGCAGVARKNRLVASLPAIVAFVAVFAGQYLSTGYPHMRLCFLLLAAKAFSVVPEQDVAEKEVSGA